MLVGGGGRAVFVDVGLGVVGCQEGRREGLRMGRKQGWGAIWKLGRGHASLWIQSKLRTAKSIH
jgi:hypothetical protein